MPPLSSKVVAVTGASAGIGYATVRQAATAGACVVASARRADRLETLVREIRAAGGQAIAVPADVTRETDMHDLVDRAVAGVQMAHHEESQISQHLLAGVPHGTYAECFADPERDPVWQTMWANRPAIKDGIMEVTQDPGFGLILDEGLVRKYRVD